LDWRLIVNGHLDELLYDRKTIRTDMPFAKWREFSLINQHAINLQGKDFSPGMRAGMILK